MPSDLRLYNIVCHCRCVNVLGVRQSTSFGWNTASSATGLLWLMKKARSDKNAIHHDAAIP